MLCIKLIFLAFFLVPMPSWGGPNPAELHKRALSQYDLAMNHFGISMGEREDLADPAVKVLNRSAADLLCLKGDVAGCLDASSRRTR